MVTRLEARRSKHVGGLAKRLVLGCKGHIRPSTDIRYPVEDSEREAEKSKIPPSVFLNNLLNVRDSPLSDFLEMLAQPFTSHSLTRNVVLRLFVLEMTPDISERVDIKARTIGYSYGPKYADMVGMIMPTKAGVNLGIAYAMELPDPKKLLEGTGKLHRHIKLKSMSDLESAALKALLTASIAATVRRREKAAQKAKK